MKKITGIPILDPHIKEKLSPLIGSIALKIYIQSYFGFISITGLCPLGAQMFLNIGIIPIRDSSIENTRNFFSGNSL